MREGAVIRSVAAADTERSTTSRRVTVAASLGATLGVIALLSCGSRTGLDLPLRHDARALPAEAAPDTAVPVDAGRDAPFDADAAVLLEADAAVDAEAAPLPDAIAPVDGHVGPDSSLACPGNGVPNAYVFDDTGALYTFDPAALAVHAIGNPHCSDATPFTMSVSRSGKAYLVYMDWSIYEVDLTTLACSVTPFQPGQFGLLSLFSVAVSRTGGPEELFIYGAPAGGLPILAKTPLAPWNLTLVGPIHPTPPLAAFSVDMQGDPLGHLYGLASSGLVVEVEASTATLVGQAQTNLQITTDWALMTYENQVYLFAENQVARFDVPTQSAVLLGTLPFNVVGASAVPCFHAD